MNVTCVALGESYDAYIPKSVTVGEAATLLARCMEDATNGRYVASDAELLCSGVSGNLLNASVMVGDCGITNGDKLLLF